MFTVTQFNLSITGLQFSFQSAFEQYTTKNCPKETCALLEESGLIEGFDIDSNGEPVILYTDKSEPSGYGYAMWFEFVKTFPASVRIGEMILEALAEQRMFKRNRLILRGMFRSLKAA